MYSSPVDTGKSDQATKFELIAGPHKHLRDFIWLLHSQLFLLREAWFWYLFQSSFVPTSYLLFLWLLMGRQSPERMAFFVAGSLVMSISFGGMLSLGQNLGALKDHNAFEYYATLPIAKVVFIAAITTRGMLLTLPSALMILFLGYVIFGLGVSPLVFLILLLSAYTMSGLGAVIGFWSPTAQIASLTTQILQTVIVLFAPVFYPIGILPEPLQLIARVWPTTYAAEALRRATSGESLAELWPLVLTLLGFIGVSLVLIPLKLDWRTNSVK